MVWFVCFFFQAEDGIRDLVRSRGLGDVYKRQALGGMIFPALIYTVFNLGSEGTSGWGIPMATDIAVSYTHLTLPTSDLV